MLKKDSINILFIVILALIIAGLCLKFLPSFRITSDTIEYDGAAINLVQGRGLTLNNEPAKEPFGYPLFLAGIYYLFGHDWQIVRFIQYILLGGMGIIFYFMGRKFLNFRPIWAFFSSLTFILWPYFIVYPIFIETEIPFIFLLLLSAYFLLAFLEKPSFKNSLIPGILLGIAALIRPVAIMLPFWIVFLLLIFLKGIRKKAFILKLALILVVFSAVFSPWIIRNYLYFDQPIPVFSRVIEKSYVEIPAREEGEANFETMVLTRLKNIYLFWNPGAGGANARDLQETFPMMGALFLAYRVLFFVVLALAFLSLKWIRENKNVFLLWLIIFYTWALHTVLWTYPRYTLPIIPLIIILAWFSLRNILYKTGEKA